MTYLLLTNVAAGSAQAERVEVARDELARHAPTDLVHSRDPDELDAVLDELGDRTLVVAGGDGSVHLVVNRLAARGQLGRTPVGVVPLGTGNDLARTLGLPLDPREAAAAVAAGHERRLDVLVDDAGTVVVNCVHAGLGAEAAERSAPMKDGLGPLAYPVGALIAGASSTGWELEVVVDGRPLTARDARVLMVAVGVGVTIGGGTPVAPDAVPDDGLADVVVSTAVGPAARVAFAAALRQGTHLERDDVVGTRGREITIRGDAVPYNADGEVSEPVAERVFAVRAGAWSVLAPVTPRRGSGTVGGRGDAGSRGGSSARG